MNLFVNKKLLLKTLLWLVFIAVALTLSLTLFIEPWLRRTIQFSVHQLNNQYTAEINNVHVRVLSFGILMEGLKLCQQSEQGDSDHIVCEIDSLDITGIDLFKALFHHDFHIRALTISNSNVDGYFSLSKKHTRAFLMPVEIQIDRIHLNQTNLIIRDSLSPKTYTIRGCTTDVNEFFVHKGKTLSWENFETFDLRAQSFAYTTADSLYTFTADSILYTTASQNLSVDRFRIQPNYAGYAFTARNRYQTDRIEASFYDNVVYGFCAEDLLSVNRFYASYVAIGKMDLDVFRDRRKEFRHETKPVFQDILYAVPTTIHLDSVNLLLASIIYTEHAEKANNPGTIRFTKVNATLVNISNDSLRKNANDTLILKAEAFVSGKGKLRILAKGKLFDPKNTFEVEGSLSAMPIGELNHILNRNAFLYAYGKINAMHFNFMANNYNATGKMLFLYSDLVITVKNKNTDDTTGLKEVLMTKLGNKKLLDANPIKGEATRIGQIDYIRDPEKTFFNYCLKAVLSGMKSSVDKSSIPKKD